MALEAVVFAQDPLSSYTSCSKEYNLYNYFGMNYEFANNNNYSSKLLLEDNNNNNNNNNQQADFCSNGIFDNYDNQIPNNSEMLIDNVNQWDHHQHTQPPQLQPSQLQQQYSVLYDYSSPEEYISGEPPPPLVTPAVGVTTDGGVSRRKRRRRSSKNKEEVEQQRMTHIAVERNRRKQMNDYLAVIRSLMPPSYVQRGDQASIVGGAINYVKELEQLLQSMEAQKKNVVHHFDHQNQEEEEQNPAPPNGDDVDNKVVESLERAAQPAFAGFFSFPQYSTRSSLSQQQQQPVAGSNSVSRNSAAGEIEVTMVDSHANVKILAKKQTKQLIKLIAGFQGLRLNVLHLNVTSLDNFVLYSLSVKVEEGCQLNSVDDIAAAANHILGQIQEEAAGLVQ